jgi:hypothetical protein
MDNPEKQATFGHTRRRQQKKRVGHYYSQTNTNNINKTSALLQSTEGKDELHM